MNTNEWVKQVLKDLVQDLGRAQARINLLSDQKVGQYAAIALHLIGPDRPHTLKAFEEIAREALAAVEEDS